MFAPTARLKPPLCKGRWHGVAVTEGLGHYEGRPMYGQGHNPSVCAIAQPAPFTQGSHPSTPIEFILAPEGSNGEGFKSVKKNAALLHFLAFGPFDHLIGVLRGEQPLSRAPRLGSSGTFLLLFWSQKRRKSGGRPLKKALPQGRQGRQGAPTPPNLYVLHKFKP